MKKDKERRKKRKRERERERERKEREEQNRRGEEKGQLWNEKVMIKFNQKKMYGVA